MLATLNNISGLKEQWLIKSNEAGFLKITFTSLFFEVFGYMPLFREELDLRLPIRSQFKAK
jgi:hypothetical protein